MHGVIPAVAEAEEEAEQWINLALIRQAARTAYDEAGGDLEKARELMCATALESARPKAKVKDPLLLALIRYACDAAVLYVQRERRRDVWHPDSERRPGYSPPSKAALEAQAGRVISIAKTNLMLFMLPVGKPLGEATKEDVIAAAHAYRTRAADEMVKARWLDLIAAAMKGRNNTVIKELTNDKLHKLKEEARNG